MAWTPHMLRPTRERALRNNPDARASCRGYRFWRGFMRQQRFLSAGRLVIVVAIVGLCGSVVAARVPQPPSQANQTGANGQTAPPQKIDPKEDKAYKAFHDAPDGDSKI